MSSERSNRDAEGASTRAEIEVLAYHVRAYERQSISVTVKLPDDQSVIVELENDGEVSVCAYDANGDDISEMKAFEYDDTGWSAK